MKFSEAAQSGAGGVKKGSPRHAWPGKGPEEEEGAAGAVSQKARMDLLGRGSGNTKTAALPVSATNKKLKMEFLF